MPSSDGSGGGGRPRRDGGRLMAAPPHRLPTSFVERAIEKHGTRVVRDVIGTWAVQTEARGAVEIRIQSRQVVSYEEWAAEDPAVERWISGVAAALTGNVPEGREWMLRPGTVYGEGLETILLCAYLRAIRLFPREVRAARNSVRSVPTETPSGAEGSTDVRA